MSSTLTVADSEEILLAGYAMRASESAGREHPEPQHSYRSAFQRDRDRITHCAAFRRLSYKTQVFTGDMTSGDAKSGTSKSGVTKSGDRGDYHRTRLTHTLEVASIARTLARALRLNEDLVEALALLHDIGHPPFGHAGEEVLDKRLAGQGRFNHNDQALRIVQRLEIRYPSFPGLNLSREVLEGQTTRGGKGRSQQATTLSPLLEVQVVDAADSIAYDAHDADDALEWGLLTIDDLTEVSLWRDAANRVRKQHGSLTELQLRRAVIHALIDAEVSNMVSTARQQIEQLDLQSTDDVRQSPRLLTPPPEIASQKSQLQAFLFARVYRHPRVLEQREATTHELGALFDHYSEHPEQLPTLYQEIADQEGTPRAAADYVASHTDRSAREAYRQL